MSFVMEAHKKYSLKITFQYLKTPLKVLEFYLLTAARTLKTLCYSTKTILSTPGPFHIRHTIGLKLPTRSQTAYKPIGKEKTLFAVGLYRGRGPGGQAPLKFRNVA